MVRPKKTELPILLLPLLLFPAPSAGAKSAQGCASSPCISITREFDPRRVSHYFPLGSNGAPGEDRTPDPKFRKLVLYPTELRAHWEEDSKKVGGRQLRRNRSREVPVTGRIRADLRRQSVRSRPSHGSQNADGAHWRHPSGLLQR